MSHKYDYNVNSILIVPALLLILGGLFGVSLIEAGEDSLLSGVVGLIVSVACLSPLPWIVTLPGEPTNFLQRMKDYRKDYIRSGLTIAIVIGLIIYMGIVTANNISNRITEKQKAVQKAEAEAQYELEQAQIEQEKQNTPKPQIDVATNLDQIYSTTGIILDFSVSNADSVFLNGTKLEKVDSYSDTHNLYSAKIGLIDIETTINIRAENKYWQDTHIDRIVREKNEEELEKDKLKELYGKCIFYSKEFCYIHLSEKPYTSRTSAKKDCEARGGDLTTKDDIELHGNSLSELVTNENISHIWTREEKTVYGRVYGLSGNRSDRATKESEKRSYVGYFCVKDLEIQPVATSSEAINKARNEMISIYKEIQSEHKYWLDILSSTEASPEFAKTIHKIQKLREKINPFEKPYTDSELKKLQMAIWNYSSEIASLAPGWYDNERKASIERTQNEVEKLIQ